MQATAQGTDDHFIVSRRRHAKEVPFLDEFFRGGTAVERLAPEVDQISAELIQRC